MMTKRPECQECDKTPHGDHDKGCPMDEARQITREGRILRGQEEVSGR